MGKLASEVPAELKSFAGLFDQLSYRHSNYGTVFCDFIDYWTAGMLLDGDPDLAKILENKYEEDYRYFNLLIVEMLKAYDRMIVDDSCWYDGLGIFYEIIASRYKSSALGQFFTPAPVVDLMSQILSPSEKDEVLDCCCGSGRMLLSAKVINPKITGYAADVDPVCAKMSAINMALHGIRGEVSCMDSLSMEWRFGYILNPMFRFPGIPPIPHLSPISCFENSSFYVKKTEVKASAVVQKQTGQLTLF